MLFALLITPAFLGADARFYVQTSDQSEIETYSASTGKLAGLFEAGINASAFLLDPDGVHAYVANTQQNNVLFVDLSTGETTETFPAGTNPLALALSANSQFLYILNSGSKTLTAVNLSTNQQFSSVAISGNDLTAIVAGQDNSTVYVATESALQVVNTQEGVVTATISMKSRQMVLGPSGASLFVTVFGGPSLVEVVATGTNKVVGSVPASSNYSNGGIAISPDGTHLYVGTDSGLAVVSTATDTVTQTILTPADEGIGPIALSPKASQIFAIGSSDVDASVLETFDLATNTLTKTAVLGGFVSACVPAPDGSGLYILFSNAFTVDTFDATTNRSTGIIQNVFVQYALTASADGSTIGGLARGFISLIDTSTHQVRNIIPVPTDNALSSLALNSNASMAYYPIEASENYLAIAFMDLTTGVVGNTVQLSSLNSSYPYVVLSPDGATVYVDYRMTDNYWDLCSIDIASAALRTCVTLSTNVNTDYSASPLAVSPDGTKVYVIDGEMIAEYDAQTFKLLATVKVAAVGMAVSAAQNSLYVLSESLTRIDLTTFTVAGASTTVVDGYTLAVSPDGSEVYEASILNKSGTENLIDVFDGESLALITSLEINGFPEFLAAAPQ